MVATGKNEIDQQGLSQIFRKVDLSPVLVQKLVITRQLTDCSLAPLKSQVLR